MSIVRSLIFAIVFYGGSVPIVIAAAVAIPLGSEAALVTARCWARFHGWCVRNLLGIRLVVEGTLPQEAAIVAIKHESMFETIEILRLFDRPAVVFKAELTRIPLWGRVARRHGVIPVAREAGASALRAMLAAAKRAVADGRPIIIFPEGTRVAPGTSPPLRPGIAGLYKSTGLPIVPVALDSGRLWPRRKFTKQPGIVRMVVGETIPPGLPREIVEPLVHERINALNPRTSGGTFG